MTNCVNCGAPLHGTKCEYCGTEYTEDRKKIKAEFSKNDAYGVLEINGQNFSVYLGRMEATFIHCQQSGRGLDGHLYREKPILKHKFILIER